MIRFFYSLCSRKKMIEKKSRNHGKLCGKKTEEILNSILVPWTAQPTHRINKEIDFEKWDFEHIFDDPSFFLNSQCSTTKTIEKKSRKHAKLYSKKIEKILNSILVPLTAQVTLRINKKINFEKWDFQHIFDDPSFLRVGVGGGYVNSENSDCDVFTCPWHTRCMIRKHIRAIWACLGTLGSFL